jgi:hypothetical protein
MTIEELVDYVQMDLTMSGALPKILPEKEIRRLIVDIGEKFFYENYWYAVQKAYYFVPRAILEEEEFTKYKYVTLPCEIQSITYIYPITDNSLYQLGVSAPNLSINLGVTNQPYLSSYTTTIGELGTYKTVIDGFSDVLNMLSKHTLKYDYNFNTNRLHILTALTNSINRPGTNLILEVYARIPKEDLYEDQKFRRYVTALGREQMGRLVLRYNFSLPGGIQLNVSEVMSEAREDKKAVEEEMKKVPNTGFFMMVKR